MISLDRIYDYVLRGERGPTLVNFLFFLIFNCIFIYLVTLLWNAFLGKDLGLYRLYFSSAFSSWVALTSSVHFGGWNNESYTENIKYVFFASLLIFIFQFLISIYILCYPLGLITFIDSLKIIMYQSFCFLILSPIVITMSIIRSLNALTRSIIRIIWRLLFFLTPIIWMPSEMLLSIRGNWVLFNPFTLIALPSLNIIEEPILTFPNDVMISLFFSFGSIIFICFLFLKVGNDTLGNYFSNMVSPNERKNKFEKNNFPSYFSHNNVTGKKNLSRIISTDDKIRLTFKLDVQNNYFSRLSKKGKLTVLYKTNNKIRNLYDFKSNFKNGLLKFSCNWPENHDLKEELDLQFLVNDNKNKFNLNATLIPKAIKSQSE